MFLVQGNKEDRYLIDNANFCTFVQIGELEYSELSRFSQSLEIIFFIHLFLSSYQVEM